MAHELTVREDGMVEMAFIGNRGAVWHGLGQNLDENSSIETWKKEAGMDWEVFESAVKFETAKGSSIFPDKKALFRSDTNSALSIVGSDYKIVQPGEVLDFFQDLVKFNDMKLSTAGTLFGGKRFWALANVGKETKINGNDEVKAHLLLTTSVDGTLATTAKFVAERVVCNNTLTVALGENSKSLIKVTHKSLFDSKDVQINLGLLDEGWDKFSKDITLLSEKTMSDDDVREFYQDLMFNKSKTAEDQSWGDIRKVKQLLECYGRAEGAAMAKGNAWGALNGVTYLFTHGSGKRDQSHQFWDSYNGGAEKIKYKAMEMLLAA